MYLFVICVFYLSNGQFSNFQKGTAWCADVEKTDIRFYLLSGLFVLNQAKFDKQNSLPI